MERGELKDDEGNTVSDIPLLIQPFLFGERDVAFAHGAMGHRFDPSWGGPIVLFLVPASSPRLVYQRLWYVLSCLWDDASKRTLAANRKE